MKPRWKQFLRSFEIPFDPINEESNQENIVISLINLITAITAAYLVVIILRGAKLYEIPIFLGMIGITFLARSAVHHKKTKAVSVFLVSVLWLFTTIMTLFYENGLRAPAYPAALMFLIVYAGLLHGGRAVTIVAALSIFVNLIVGALEMHGIFLTEPRIPDIRMALIAQIIFIPATAFLITKTLGNLKLSISLYRDEAKIRHRSEQNVIRLHRELEAAYETTLEGWALALELRDSETEGHSRRVTDLTVKLARKFNFTEEEIKFIQYGALLHDIGKMGIPDGILNKPGKLTPEERAIVNRHPTYAFELLKGIDYLQQAIAIPYAHHEQWDGRGYPRGLRGEEIPLPARIFTVVDHWDALRSNRPYRDKWTKKKTLAYIQSQSGKKFDPRVVDVFLKNIDEFLEPAG